MEVDFSGCSHLETFWIGEHVGMIFEIGADRSDFQGFMNNKDESESLERNLVGFWYGLVP